MLCGFALRLPKILPAETIPWYSRPTRTVIQNVGVLLSALRVSWLLFAISFIALAANQNWVVSAICVSRVLNAAANFSSAFAIRRFYRSEPPCDAHQAPMRAARARAAEKR